VWFDAYKFWVKIFALTFALGVVSGITMSFQFGTNWPGFMNKVGDIAGPLLAYEVMTAFFMEATFLGIMLFGIKRVSPRVHTIATALVAIGVMLSAFWIISLNSWMHTPAGYKVENSRIVASSWYHIIFNPSMLPRFFHMILASFLTVAFLLSGISAYKYLLGDKSDRTILVMRFAVIMAAIVAPTQIIVGDVLGINTLQHNPAKIAAIEAVWDTQKGAPLILFAIPNEKEQRNDYAIEVPKLASIILTHHIDGEIKGLKEFDEHPKVAPLFYGFRIMVATGFLMLGISWLASFLLLRKKELPKLILYGLLAMTFSGWVATVAGWYVTEIGRQPWLVFGILKTKDALAAIPQVQLVYSLAGYITLYILLIIAYISTIFYMAKLSAST
jgi:cytochrome bd ubiquinol oxidase subunit I